MMTRMLLPVLLMTISVVSARSMFEESSTNGEFLPEDTFRKLAAVLYRRGDKAENRLKRKYLFNSNVTCNDGSSAGYYIRRNSETRRWVIYLEGGWFCYDDISCEARWHRLRTLMSSERWPEVKTVGGILSSDRHENPHFAEANHVLVPYCSSDSWSGTARADTKSGAKFSFLGAEILAEVVRELFSWEKLGSGRELYLVGSSAGGTGVLVNLDNIADLVRSLGSDMRVRGVVDSGWFLDNDPFSESGETRPSPARTVSIGAHLWQARVPDACAQHFPGDEWKCFFGYRLYPTMRTPVFIFQWQFDEAQMSADNVGAPVTQAQWNFIHHQGRNIRKTLESVSAVFAPSCISHTVLTKPDWAKVTVDGVSLPDALQCWASQTQPGETEDLEARDGSLFRIQNDSPQENARINANMLKALNHYHMSSKENKSNVRDNRTNKRMRKRGRRHRKQCRYGDSLENRIRCAQEESSDSALRLSGGSNRRNRDLVRSLESKRRRRRRRQRSESQRQRHKLSREERKRLRREERRRQKRLISREKKSERRLRSRQKKESRMFDFPDARKQKSLSVRSIQMRQPQCPQKHVDTCSWPQCNISCPKLHNPLTGEEMDFLELLKSFGLDMQSVAKALGIDEATLNNMDKEVLLHLLTSQASIN